MAYAMIPAKAGDHLPDIEALAAPEGALAATLTWPDGAVHHFIHNPAGLELTLGPVRTSAHTALAVVSGSGQVSRLFQYSE
jgi:hypothetical protein